MNRKILLLFLSLILASCKSGNEQSEAPMRVKVSKAVSSETARHREFAFIAKPFRTSVLSFRVSGPIDKFDVYSGKCYSKGEVIAQIDQRDFILRHENAQAIYRRAEADYKRIEALYEKNNVSASAYEQARAAWISAKTDFEACANELEDTQLRAPFDGYAGEVHIEKYQDVRATQPVITFVDISQLRIEAYVTEDVAMQADKVGKVSLSFDRNDDEIMYADVVECARSTTSNNLSYLLTAILPNPGGNLPGGLSGRVFIDLPGDVSKIISVPLGTICHSPTKGDYVWIVDPHTQCVYSKSVTLGELLPGGQVSILKGIEEGDMVAASGLRFLWEGAEVETE